MFTNLQLEIIKKFGRKELTEGCVIFNKEMQRYFVLAGVGEVKMNGHPIYVLDGINAVIPKGPYMGWDYEILGSIPEIFPDVARFIHDKGWFIISSFEATRIKKGIEGEEIEIYINPILPLLEQDESILEQLLNLK